MLPWTTLALTVAGYYARVTRAAMDEVRGREFVMAARSKGITERQVVVRHVLRNSLLPLVGLFGLDVCAVFAGAAILVEPIFGTQGVGQYAAEAISSLDFPALMGVTLVGAAAVVVCSTLIDIVQGVIDPRVRAR